MITSIEIDGFKSLRNFKMEFRKGLNVLAGPNGSGKTNILQALELLTYLFSDNIATAIEDANEKFEDIKPFLCEDYKIRYAIKGIDYKKEYLIEFTVNGETGELENHSPDFNSNILYHQSVKDNFIHEITNGEHPVISDINDLRIYSLDPDLIRMIGSKRASNHIGMNGKNVSNAIAAILEPNFTRIGRFYDVRGTKDDLITYFRLCISDLNEISIFTREVSPDIDIDIEIKSQETSIKKSIKTLSSGEALWVAISTILISSNLHEIAFDEPDRHLHPDMIQKMISLFRDHAEQGPGWLLMTTHNETVLNACDVDEVHLVYLNEHGHTQVGPVDNAEDMKDLIYRSGRGLGSYYVSGSLQPKRA